MITEVSAWHTRGGEAQALFGEPGKVSRGYSPTATSMRRLQSVVYRMVMRGTGALRPWLASSGNVGWEMERVEWKERKEEER